MKLNRWLSIVVLCTVAFSAFAASPVRINEFMANNGSGLVDDFGNTSDWIELYNDSDAPVNLLNWSLTDDPDNITQWKFPNVSIPARGYLVVIASGANTNTATRMHTSFSLTEGGEFLGLFDSTGAPVTIFDPDFPSQYLNVSYGYNTTGALVYFSPATPGAANTGGLADAVGDTKFSHDRGFYDAPFDLSITTTTAGATIRYTTNGLPPTEAQGAVYTGPIRISGTTVIRAAAFRTGSVPSNADTQTYLFLNDVIRQSANGAPPPGWPSSWGANVVDYGMDPDIVNNPQWSSTIINDLKSLPSFSIVMSLNDLFNSSTGIYANPGQDGIAWERQCSLELLNPTNSNDGFQVNAGIRIRGGFSRSTSNPKHAFRFFFRGRYGDGKLVYPLFGDNAAQEFDKIDLRTFQNYSWSFQGDGNGIFLRDQWNRDTQLEMGHQGERGNFYHLFINGQYWGVFNTCERPEASYGETYYGGSETNYDTVKVEAGPYTVNATDGNMTAWTALYNLARAGLSTDAAYQRILGNNPDGTPNPAYPVYIDLDNLIDYMLIVFYSGNLDAPISNFLGNDRPNNWYGLRNRDINSRMAFMFFSHDGEHTLLPWNEQDRTGPFPAGDTSVAYSSPQYIFKQMTQNAEFRLKVADRVHKYFFNNGLLTPTQNRARLLRRKAEIDRAVVGESARWGDSKRSTPFNRNDWQAAVDNVLNNFFPNRTDEVLSQIRADNLYPNVTAPSFNQFGGNVNPNFSLTITAPAGQIYYTLDGFDPRSPGGSVSSRAILYSSAIPLNQNVTVKARVLSNGTWSALTEAQFNITRTFKDLIITEIMYNPPGSPGVDGDDFEFVEFKNIGGTELDLSGIRFTNGIQYVFPVGTRLGVGAFHVIVKNPTQFSTKYPGVAIGGIFSNNLANSGERLSVVHAAGALIQQFTYDDNAPWPISADGAGFSLVPTVFSTTADYSLAANWRASSAIGGSPGRDDPIVNIAPVVINEILTHTDLPAVDAIELHNPTTTAVDVGGWYLTDDQNTPKKFRIPTPTVIQPGGYVVFDEGDFNPTPGGSTNFFALSSVNDEVFLYSATSDGNTLTGYSQGFNFRAAENGVSFGRYTNSVGEILYPAQQSITLGALNSGPRVGPVVINEINYHPNPSGDEFVEIKNITASPVNLFDPARPTNTWRFEGIDFVFPPNTVIPPNGLIVVSGIEPAVFKQRAGLPAQITVLGPYGGNLDNNGELIELLRPDAPELETNEFGTVRTVVPRIVADAIRYSNQLPWPTNSSGNGNSIERKVTTAFGNDPSNWRSSPGSTSPGLNNDGNRLPLVNVGADLSFVSATFPLTTNITGTATDDGLPNPPASLTYQWTQVSAPPGANVQIQNATQPTASFSFPGVGVFVLRLTVSDGEYATSDDISVSISRPLASQTLIPEGATWKYLDTGASLASTWRAVNYTEPGWKTGGSPLGYGDPVVTTVSYGTDSLNKFRTTYFRHSFNLASASSVASLELGLRRDDGAIVYLNDREIFRSNMPEGPVDNTTQASSIVGGADETTFWPAPPIDVGLLLNGKNVIAVEVHQVSGDSSDKSFDLRLTAQVSFNNTAPTAAAGPDRNVQMPAAATLTGTAGDDGLPNPPGVFNVSWSMVTGPGSVTFANPNLAQTTATFSQAGTYVLRMNVTDGQLSASDDVQVTVTGTTDPYVTWKQQNFTAAELANASISGDNADPDNDTFTNQQEYIAGTRPKDAASFLHVAQVGVDGDDAVLQFEAVGDKSYTVLGRDEAGSGIWERVLDLSPQGTTESIEVLDPTPKTKAKRFYRVVTPQRPPE